MRDISREKVRVVAVIGLRAAAIALLEKKGKPSQTSNGSIVFEQHTPENPTPRLSLHFSSPPDGRSMLSVWATLKGKNIKVLNIEWLGDNIQVVSFRRGEWESELLAMSRVGGVNVH